MFFQRIKSEGLAHNSYLVGTGSEAAVIDPRRDCQIYIDLAQEQGLRIKYIFETHRNEDFVIGSLQLSQLTAAEIYHGSGLNWQYGITLAERQKFEIGDLTLMALHTPGHTDESVCYTLTDPASGGATVMVFSGDTLFVNEVGRTDLYGPKEASRLAFNLYESIFHRLLPLGDAVILCPTHGAGSICGTSIGKRDESTLGIERMQNPVLQIKEKDAFVKFKVAEQLEQPYYFRQMEKYNLEGPPLLCGLPSPPALNPTDFQAEVEKGALLIDTRPLTSFGGAHITGSYSIWLDGLPGFAGWILPYNRPALLVLEDQSHLEKAVTYLMRLGYDNIAGYLEGGLEAWYSRALPLEYTPLISVHELKDKIDRREELTVLDVRSQAEWDTEHIENALHIYVGYLESRLSEVPRERPVAVHCNVGNRASLGASILQRAGYRVCNVLGSMKAWKTAGFPVTKSVATAKV